MEISIEHNNKKLQGILVIPRDLPKEAVGIVVFAHGSGSSRFSERNSFVAHELHKKHLATLLIDLLTEEEAVERRNIFDIELLAERLMVVRDWLREESGVKNVPCAYFGASTGAAAALIAAARKPDDVSAIVCRGGRPDLVSSKDLESVKCPTLLIVGGKDTDVLELNRNAFNDLHCEKKLDVVPDAGHLFEESGAMDRVAELAGAWFVDHLAPQEPLQLTGTCG